MAHTRIEVRCAPELSEVLIAFLGELPFDMFEENEQGFDAYAPSAAWGDSERGALEALRSDFSFAWQETELPYVNWNEVWEQHFEPVEVDAFCRIRAEFHPVVAGFAHEFVMAPKMAFGTGHHATTRMVIQAMRDLDFAGKSVLDYGCGTAILAMLAMRLGAHQAWAIDYDPNATENALENLTRNEVSGVEVLTGDLEVLPAGQLFDVVLANINKNVLTGAFAQLAGLCVPGGTVVLSGFLSGDEADMLELVRPYGFTLQQRLQEKDWICLVVAAG
jgi:ribosomal protein L11 methyltransferase